mmetsp:Transcript_85652/g.223214  ORF Transcript_85652/g.223214 Transcript_85652/m.223214 type:complete len:219 (-) Transcript_85652:58-714(-)
MSFFFAAYRVLSNAGSGLHCRRSAAVSQAGNKHLGIVTTRGAPSEAPFTTWSASKSAVGGVSPAATAVTAVPPHVVASAALSISDPARGAAIASFAAAASGTCWTATAGGASDRLAAAGVSRREAPPFSSAFGLLLDGTQRSLPEILTLTQPSSGPKPEIFLKCNRSPCISNSSISAPVANRTKTTGDEVGRPSRTTMPPKPTPPTTSQVWAMLEALR